MAFSVEIHCNSSFLSPHNMEKTLELLSDYEESIGKHFEGLESFRSEGDGVYLWTFQKLSYGGYNLQIQFRTRFEKRGDKIGRAHV